MFQPANPSPRTLLLPTIFGLSLATLLVTASVYSMQTSAPKVVAPAGKISDLNFLEGNWRGPMWGGEFKASYTSSETGVLLSYSELWANGSVQFFEFERFYSRAGVPTLMPFPKGKPAAMFTLTEVDSEAHRAVFENPSKDFPTQIEYHQKGKNQLVITLSDPHNKLDRKEVFDLKRDPAPSTPLKQ